MEQSGNAMLLRLINSSHFDLNLCISYLQKYSDNIGIHYYLCQHASKYPIDELRFFIPQFLQLLITVETDSMALEELVKNLCIRDVHYSLLTFWHLQAFLQELSKDPQSVGFQICKKMLNDLQFQLFNMSINSHTINSSHVASSGVVPHSLTLHNGHHNKTNMSFRSRIFRENVAPAIILSSSILSGIGMPQSTYYAEPLVKVQGKQLKSLVFEVVKDVKRSLTENLTRKNTLNNALLGRSREEVLFSDDDYDSDNTNNNSKNHKNLIKATKSLSIHPSASSPALVTNNFESRKSQEIDFSMIDSYADVNLPSLSRPSLRSKRRPFSNSPLSKSMTSTQQGSTPALQSKSRITSDSTSSNGVASYSSSPPSANDQSNAQRITTHSMPNLHSLSRTSSFGSINDAIPYETDGSYAASIRNSYEFRESSDIDSLDSDYSQVNNIDSYSSLSPTNSLVGLNGNSIDSAISANGVNGNIARIRKQHIPLNIQQQMQLLKSNYFKNETQLVIGLQNISIRLSKVPKEARLSTLKAELSYLNRDLPCEIDLPTLLPRAKRGKLNKIVHIAVNESAVLNSAERVPYLLIFEYLSDEVDFDPTSKENQNLLKRLDDSTNNNNFKNNGSQSFKKNQYRFDLAGTDMATASSSTINVDSNDTPSTLKDGEEGDAQDGYKPVSTAEKYSALSKIQSIENPSDTDLGDVSVIKFTNNNEKEALVQERFISSKKSVPKIDSKTAEVKKSENDANIDKNMRDLELTFRSKYSKSGDDNKDNDLANQMRIAAVMLTQLEASGSTMPSQQAAQIKARIINSMKSMQNSFGIQDLEDIHGAAGERKLSNDLKVAGLSYLGEDWNTKKERIRKESKYGHLENWDLFSVIAKTGDDLTQEAFACQLIHSMSKIWYAENVKVWVKKMKILVTSSNTGLVETITNALSIHSIKKSLTQHMTQNGENPNGEIATLKDHFLRVFGDENSPKYRLAQENFCISLAAYSVICYILQIKDRHNGNIMLDSEGHIVHIDFGFLLSNSPGSVGFEAAPFKLTMEYIELLGGLDSPYFARFKELTKDAFKALRKHSDPLINMVELMQKDSNLPCFKAGESTSVQMRQRLQLHLNDEECDKFIENFLINKSIGSIYTRLYDQFQLITQGIFI
ncbi:hypothetical protein B5S32_g142 [[Candida] boidinii]|nr:hypothetical protein B5S32_g142 [[Candida] boidinii]